MQQVKNLFEAEAANLSGTMCCHASKAGFKIPDYQRTYDWKTENIKRLLEDCLDGFYYLSQPRIKESYTFLGTIILVKELSAEPTFDGKSLIVVDGQQRLTTLCLLCCVLIECINAHTSDIDILQQNMKEWLEEEIQFHLDVLFECVVGQLPERGKIFPYPRIVRDGDYRARQHKDADYHSNIARFLKDFSDYYQNMKDTFSPDEKNTRLFENYTYIKEQIDLSMQNKDCKLEYQGVSCRDFERAGLRGLFEKLNSVGASQEQDRTLSEISKKPHVENLIRLILFSSYLTKCVVLTRVETQDENYAFDIFDALNTTGEPLTALETLRPKIIEFEKKLNGYDGSESQQHLNNIKRHLDDVFIDTDKRQKATKELLVSFALYLEGHKLSLNLNSQRTYLRSKFSSVSSGDGANLKRRFVSSISDIAEFRHCYWSADEIRKLDSLHPSLDDRDVMKLCIEFIRDMNTSLAIPVLARYWVQYRNNNDEDAFFAAIKSLTAFIALRRAVTGNTGGIDSDFRRLMQNPPDVGGDPLCVGVDHSNNLISVDAFKKELSEYLSKERINITEASEWIDKVSNVPLASHSRPLCRFLLLAAAHNARSVDDDPGLMSRYDLKISEERNFFNFKVWDGENYATVEHVAPESDSGSGWDVEIYRQPSTRHTIGNLLLLPKDENSAIGNSSWRKKKIFYTALAAATKEETNISLNKAKDEGFAFKKRTEEMLLEGKRLHLLDPVIRVGEWNKEFIERRTQNILELAWDTISPWLYNNK